jgi:hypothetical protein
MRFASTVDQQEIVVADHNECTVRGILKLNVDEATMGSIMLACLIANLRMVKISSEVSTRARPSNRVPSSLSTELEADVLLLDGVCGNDVDCFDELAGVDGGEAGGNPST